MNRAGKILGVAVLVTLPFLWPLARDAWAAVDAFFAGRSIRMTRTTYGAASNCDGVSAYSCLQFDNAPSPKVRFWNGTTYGHVIHTPSPSPRAQGAVLYSDGSQWQQLPAGSNGQVLTVGDGGVPHWVTP